MQVQKFAGKLWIRCEYPVMLVATNFERPCRAGEKHPGVEIPRIRINFYDSDLAYSAESIGL